MYMGILSFKSADIDCPSLLTTFSVSNFSLFPSTSYSVLQLRVLRCFSPSRMDPVRHNRQLISKTSQNRALPSLVKLIRRGADVNWCENDPDIDASGRNAFHWACFVGNKTTVAKMVEENADVSTTKAGMRVLPLSLITITYHYYYQLSTINYQLSISLSVIPIIITR
jgi:hypothetical protein